MRLVKGDSSSNMSVVRQTNERTDGRTDKQIDSIIA